MVRAFEEAEAAVALVYDIRDVFDDPQYRALDTITTVHDPDLGPLRMRRGMPQSPNHPPFRMVLERRHGDMVRSDGGSAANEVIITGGHVGTHVDALAHVSQDGLVYGGLRPDGITGHNGFSELGIDGFTPYVGRCLLLGVAAVHGVRALPPGYEITAADLDEAAAGLDPRPGEALLIGTGWSRLWADGPAFTGREDGVSGPGEEAGHRLAERRPAVVGGETIAFERLAPGLGHATLPVHRVPLVDSGLRLPGVRGPGDPEP